MIHQRYLACGSILFCMLVCFGIAASSTVIDESRLSAPQLKQYQSLLKELRCLVCQNQSLAESSAELAGDLRIIVFEMVLAGSSNEEIYHFLANRYSDFVLYNPPLKAKTIPLWILPFVLLLALSLGVFFYLQKQNKKNR